MPPPKKPGDETLRGLPGPGHSAEDSFVGRTRPTDSAIKKLAEMAPEVSQGAWRERVFTPRAVLSRDEVCQGLEAALRVAVGASSQPRAASEALRAAWLPFLRQALEQVGGDGIDAWLLSLFKTPGKKANRPFFEQLAAALGRLGQVSEAPALAAAGREVVELVRAAMAAPLPQRLSFKQQERELEGKLEVDALLTIRAGSDEELTRRLEEIGGTMGQLRDQIRALPGKQPDGMYANFVRLKTELRVLDAELKRRAGTLEFKSGW